VIPEASVAPTYGIPYMGETTNAHGIYVGEAALKTEMSKSKK
jgi:hypothetical protein